MSKSKGKKLEGTGKLIGVGSFQLDEKTVYVSTKDKIVQFNFTLSERIRFNLPDGFKLIDGKLEDKGPMRLMAANAEECVHFIFVTQAQKEAWDKEVASLDKVEGGKKTVAGGNGLSYLGAAALVLAVGVAYKMGYVRVPEGARTWVMNKWPQNSLAGTATV